MDGLMFCLMEHSCLTDVCIVRCTRCVQQLVIDDCSMIHRVDVHVNNMCLYIGSLIL